MDDKSKVVLIIMIIAVVCFGYYYIMEEESIDVEQPPESDVIDPEENLGKHILSDDFWDKLGLPASMRENASSGQIRIYGLDNVTGWEIFTWYRITNHNNSWVLESEQI